MLVLLGCGVVANVALAKTKGFNGGFLMVNFGWGFAVFAGVIVVLRLGRAPQPRRHRSASSPTARPSSATRRSHRSVDRLACSPTSPHS